MPKVVPSSVIQLNGTGTEIPTLNVNDIYEEYYLYGAAIAIGNYAIAPTGTPQQNLVFKFIYKGNLDITTNSTTFSIFGQSITQLQLTKELYITCRWNGTSWDVIVKMDFSESGIVSANNLAPNAVTASAIANGSIDLGTKGIVGSLDTTKMANLAVTTAKINNLAVTDAKINDVNGSKIANISIDGSTKLIDQSVTTAKIDDDAITTAKILNLAVTDAKINNVDGSKIVNASIDGSAKLTNLSVSTGKIADDAVTNAKLATMTVNSVKVGDASGNPSDLAIASNTFPLNTGSALAAKSISDFKANYITVQVSFEETNKPIKAVRIDHLSDYEIHSMTVNVVKAIEATDPASITFYRGNYATDLEFNDPFTGISNVLLMSAANYPVYTSPTVFSYLKNFTSNNVVVNGSGGIIYMIPTKTTAGGVVEITFCLLSTV